MFDPTADPIIEASRQYREAYARAEAKIRALQLGEAFRDLPTHQPEPQREPALLEAA